MCANCEHRFLYHGDRAVTACDGGWTGMSQRLLGDQTTGPSRSRSAKERSVCYCPGWVPGEVLQVTSFSA